MHKAAAARVAQVAQGAQGAGAGAPAFLKKYLYCHELERETQNLRYSTGNLGAGDCAPITGRALSASVCP
jgi:hypothetical protein